MFRRCVDGRRASCLFFEKIVAPDFPIGSLLNDSRFAFRRLITDDERRVRNAEHACDLRVVCKEPNAGFIATQLQTTSSSPMLQHRSCAHIPLCYDTLYMYFCIFFF